MRQQPPQIVTLADSTVPKMVFADVAKRNCCFAHGWDEAAGYWEGHLIAALHVSQQLLHLPCNSFPNFRLCHSCLLVGCLKLQMLVMVLVTDQSDGNLIELNAKAGQNLLT